MPLPGFPAGWALSPHLREQPLRDRDAALALLPGWMRDSESGVRDAIADGAVVAFNREASKHAAHAASSSPAYAVGSKLDFAGAQEGIARAPGESDRDYRARLLSSGDLATPAAITAAINRILATVTAATAYYYERPDDDAFIYSKTGHSTDGYGTFLRGKASAAHQPVRHPHRKYSARGVSPPRHIFLWPKRRGTSSSSISAFVGGAFKARLAGDDGLTAPDNAHGHVIIGLPAFLQPGKSLPSDCAVHAKPATPLIDVGGNLTAAAARAGRLLSSVFTKATTAARAGASRPSGPAVYSSAAQPDIVVGKVRALLESRSMAPTQYTLFFDPERVT